MPNDLVLKHGWQNSRILKATSRGLGKLTASLTYFSGLHDTKEVQTGFSLSLFQVFSHSFYFLVIVSFYFVKFKCSFNHCWEINSESAFL